VVGKGTTATQQWLITGGCGFIGTNLIAHLFSHNPAVRIRVLDDLSTGTREGLAAVCEFVETDQTGLQTPSFSDGKVDLIVGDIRDYETCLLCSEGMDVVMHLAANTGVQPSIQDPRADMESNVMGTFNLLEAARHQGVKRFIFASSGAPLGEVVPPIHEEKAPKPVSPYGASKLAGEAYCSAYFRTFGIKTVALRFGNVYGPRSKHKGSVIAKFFRQALNGEPLEIYGDGHQTRDFIYIDDLIQAIMLSVEADAGGEVFQIATHKETTVNEIAQMVKTLVESKTGRNVTILYGDSKPGEVRRNYSDISKAGSILGYEPQYDLKEGIRKTLDFFLPS